MPATSRPETREPRDEAMILSDGDDARLVWTQRLLVRALVAVTAFVAIITAVNLTLAQAADDGWTIAARPGHVVLMRHALAPGVGDPPGLRVGDCATQRNLDETGRQQARRLRAALEKNGLRFDTVLSSAWCRCLETARLATGGEPQVFSGLNSFFDDPRREPAQVAEIKARVKSLPSNARVLMVTHQVVITALTGRTTSYGQMVVARRRLDGSLTPVATITVQ